MELTFLGATGTVTGSKHVLSVGGAKILLDCGLFQGFKQHRLLNRRALPVRPADLDVVVLSHGHLDHTGYVPLLVKSGFEGAIYCSEGTAELVRILWPDAAYLEEEAAERANRRGYSKHEPAEPLFTKEDVAKAVEQLVPIPFGKSQPLPGGVSLTLLPAGHIVGASIVQIDNRGAKLVFTGDLGREEDPVMLPPTRIEHADWLICESTYGNRLHKDTDPEHELAEITRRTLKRGGKLIIPAFAVGRTQRILYHLWRLQLDGRIPKVPIYLNSPLAQAATDIFRRRVGDHQLTSEETEATCELPIPCATTQDSIRLNRHEGPAIIIAGSGMVTGGRVVHHVRHYGPHKENTILLTGFQAPGTRGAALLDGVEELKMFGEYVPIRCEVVELMGLSAHADRNEILDWLGHFHEPPRQTFLVHGNPEATDALRLAIEERFDWKVEVPLYKDVHVLE